MEQYEPIKVLGEGSFGKVYLMKHSETRDLVCTKVSAFLASFLRQIYYAAGGCILLPRSVLRQRRRRRGVFSLADELVRWTTYAISLCLFCEWGVWDTRGVRDLLIGRVSSCG